MNPIRTIWVEPRVAMVGDVFRHLTYARICRWRWAFRQGGCE